MPRGPYASIAAVSTSDLRVTVVGVGADGWDGLTPAARAIIGSAEVVLGGPRQLELVPVADGQVHQPWPSPLSAALPELLTQFAGRHVVALASGDPMLSGIGTTLVDILGADRVTVIPHLSSVTLARARLGWSAESTAVVSVVGRDVHAALRELAPGRRVLVLSSDEKTPAALADLLVARGYGSSRFVVLGDLGGDYETVDETTAGAILGCIAAAEYCCAATERTTARRVGDRLARRRLRARRPTHEAGSARRRAGPPAARAGSTVVGRRRRRGFGGHRVDARSPHVSSRCGGG